MFALHISSLFFLLSPVDMTIKKFLCHLRDAAFYALIRTTEIHINNNFTWVNETAACNADEGCCCGLR